MLLHELEHVEFFEGTEKLLEIWFSIPERKNSMEGLRCIPREEYEKLVRYCNAEVVSYTKNKYIDSYVLSESSLFVAKDHIVLKTCGRTKLLACVKPLLELTRKYLKINRAVNMFYSRRVYLKPELQEENYQSFDQEVDQLQELFPNGTSYTLGNTKGEEWYLYTLDNQSEHTDKPDVTLEILMSELDQNKMKQFIKRSDDGRKVTEKTGISDIIPGSMHDSILFDPCGYSMNGLNDESYSTIHVTPQPHCSYVSYETNIQLEDYDTLVAKVLDAFRPGKFIITLFANERAKCGLAPSAVKKLCPMGYRCIDLEEMGLKNYSLAYGHYKRVNSFN